MTITEEWRPVIGWEGWYEVSSLGRVKRVARGPGTKRSVLNPEIGKKGYRIVTLSHGTIPTRKKLYVHELVAAAFIGPRPEGHEVNHKDTFKPNNPRAPNMTLCSVIDVEKRLAFEHFAIGEGHGKYTPMPFIQSTKQLTGETITKTRRS